MDDGSIKYYIRPGPTDVAQGTCDFEVLEETAEVPCRCLGVYSYGLCEKCHTRDVLDARGETLNEMDQIMDTYTQKNGCQCLCDNPIGGFNEKDKFTGATPNSRLAQTSLGACDGVGATMAESGNESLASAAYNACYNSGDYFFQISSATAPEPSAPGAGTGSLAVQRDIGIIPGGFNVIVPPQTSGPITCTSGGHTVPCLEWNEQVGCRDTRQCTPPADMTCERGGVEMPCQEAYEHLYVTCTGTQWREWGVSPEEDRAGPECKNWTDINEASCLNKKTKATDNYIWRAGTANLDSACINQCSGTQWRDLSMIPDTWPGLDAVSTRQAARAARLRRAELTADLETCQDWTFIDAESCEGEGEEWSPGSAITDSTCTPPCQSSPGRDPAADAALCAAWKDRVNSNRYRRAAAAAGLPEPPSCDASQLVKDATGKGNCSKILAVENKCYQTIEGGTCSVSTCIDDETFVPGVCTKCTGTQWSDGSAGAVCKNWTNINAASCGAGSNWTSGTASKDSTCIRCTGTQWSDGSAGAVCKNWTNINDSSCGAGSNWTAGTASTDSTCTLSSTSSSTSCTGTQWSDAGAVCKNWTNINASSCGAGSNWTAGTASTDSTCTLSSTSSSTSCTGTQWSDAGAACKNWTNINAASCGAGSNWTAGTASKDSKCIEEDSFPWWILVVVVVVLGGAGALALWARTSVKAAPENNTS
jgi:hypothetical protein